MGADTKIQWCHHTHNPWRGCRKVADECKNCYIVTTVPFRTRGQKHGSERVRAGTATLREPHAWNRAAEKARERRRVFCLSLGDWLDDENVPLEWLAELLKTLNDTPWLDWLLLTKRPQNWQARLIAAFPFCGAAQGWVESWLAASDSPFAGCAPNNVWIGVSAGADQAAALKIPAKVHFLSCEPMLHAMDTTHAAKFDWVIFGGESGLDARACSVEWIREGVRFCRIHGIPCFVKQLGAHITTNGITSPGEHWPRSSGLFDTGAGHWRKHQIDKKGGDMTEWPEDLRVRQFPA